MERWAATARRPRCRRWGEETAGQVGRKRVGSKLVIGVSVGCKPNRFVGSVRPQLLSDGKMEGKIELNNPLKGPTLLFVFEKRRGHNTAGN